MIPLNSLRWFREKALWKLYAFCLMPNHLHIIVQLNQDHLIGKIMGEFHKFTGHQLIAHFKNRGLTNLLLHFRSAAENKCDRKHLVWKSGLARPIEQQNVLIELLEYTHNNPLNKRWRLVEDRAHYQYSSACFYDLDKIPIIPVDDA